MLPFLIQKIPIWGVYIYIYILQWFTVDLVLNILVLLHATVSCINSLSFLFTFMCPASAYHSLRLAGRWVPILCEIECSSFKHWPENV